MANPNIILVHGLFMSGFAMFHLKNFFEKQGYATIVFSYHTIQKSTEYSAIQLSELIKSLPGSSIIVCHSLGGLLTQQALLLMEHPEHKVQKVISLGTPWQGASILKITEQYHLNRAVGESLNILFPKDEPNEWQFPNIILGSIAGQSIFGIRLLVSTNHPQLTDGTVTVEETKITGMTDHTVIPVSHTGLIFSNICAQKILQFIKTDRF